MHGKVYSAWQRCRMHGCRGVKHSKVVNCIARVLRGKRGVQLSMQRGNPGRRGLAQMQGTNDRHSFPAHEHQRVRLLGNLKTIVAQPAAFVLYYAIQFSRAGGGLLCTVHNVSDGLQRKHGHAKQVRRPGDGGRLHLLH
jgi:hypothetical protein